MDLEKIVALERQSPLRDSRIKKTKVEKDSATMYREATVSNTALWTNEKSQEKPLKYNKRQNFGINV